MLTNRGREYQDMRKMIATKDYLSGFWFAPGAISEVVELLHKINKERSTAFGKDQEFELFISSYQLSEKELLDTIRRSGGDYEYFYRNVKGIVFDINK